MPKFSRADVQAIIDAEGIESLTAKTVRVKLEERLGLEAGSLKPQKNEISDMIDTILNEGGGDDEEEEAADEEEEEEEAPKAKKAKTSKEANADELPSNKGKMSCRTRSGNEAPKNVKKQQESMKMSAKKFLDSGKAIEFDVDGNTLRGEPRSFSSGALGWYLGGKVEVEVAGQTVWAQVGCNIVIPGSNAWKR